MAIKQNEYPSKRYKNKEYSDHKGRLIESCIYLIKRGGLAYKVRIYIDHKEHIQYFGSLEEARKYRDEINHVRNKNKSILKTRRKNGILQRDAEMIEKFVALGMSAKEITKEYGLPESQMNPILSQYYKPKDGVEIIIQSKINGIEDPDKIKNITFL